MNERIENLAAEWETASKALLADQGYQIPQVEALLQETYKLCTEFKDADLVPKGFFKLMAHIESFIDHLVDFCRIDELTTPSDGAEFDAICFIIEEIRYGFYTGAYESAYPNISVDNNQGKPYVLNLEEPFLEAFIDNNR